MGCGSFLVFYLVGVWIDVVCPAWTRLSNCVKRAIERFASSLIVFCAALSASVSLRASSVCVIFMIVSGIGC